MGVALTSIADIARPEDEVRILDLRCDDSSVLPSNRCATVPFTREDFKICGLQHYPLVGMFTTYMEHLLIRAPNSDCKQWIAKVLVDEYGEGSEGLDHGAWLEEALIDHVSNAEEAEQVRRGAMASMQARLEFWSGVQNRVVTWRQPLSKTSLRERARLWLS